MAQLTPPSRSAGLGSVLSPAQHMGESVICPPRHVDTLKKRWEGADRDYCTNSGQNSPTVTLGKRETFQHFPGGPVVKNPCFHCRGHGFDPWSGN